MGTQTRTTTVRVNTHSATGSFKFDEWNDRSDLFPNKQLFLSGISYKSTYTFADDYTRSEDNRQKKKFRDDNKKDVNQDFSENYACKDCCSHALVYSDEVPYFMRVSYYVLASFLIMSFPFRLWYSSLSNRIKLNIKKSFVVYEGNKLG